MSSSQIELVYRRASVQEASPAGLTMILYDMLVDDLRRAVDAMRCGRIEERGAHLQHGLAVLQVLEGSLDAKNGGVAAQSLSRFYAYVRGQVLAAQFLCEPCILEKQIALVLDVREAWRQADSEAYPRVTSIGAAATEIVEPELNRAGADVRTQWSA